MRRGCHASVMSLCLLSFAVGGPLFAAQAGGADQPPPPYKLRPGDKLTITVLPQRGAYDQSPTIQPDGRFYYPVVGEIYAQGKTVPEINNIITEGLKNELRNYRVTVMLDQVATREEPTEPGRIIVAGAVKTPTVLPMQRNMRLIEALTQAGGGAPTADLQRVTVNRVDGSSEVVDVNIPANALAFALRPGDTIIVPDLGKAGLTASILGEVVRPGPVTFEPGATLLDLLKEAGGPTPKANLRAALLRRAGQAEPLPVDLEAVWVRGDMTMNLRLVQGDVLVVPENVTNLVYVLGAVATPGAIPLRGGERLLDILVRGGSPSQNANLGRVLLTRVAPDGTHTTSALDLKKLTTTGDITVAMMEMMPGDILVIPQRRQREGAIDNLIKYTALLSLFTQAQDIFGLRLFGDRGQGRGRR